MGGLMSRYYLLSIIATLAFVGTPSVDLDGAQTAWVHINRRGPTNASFVDLNTATHAELTGLPGITETEANEIIRGRPYQTKDELVTRKILTADTFAKIESRVTLIPPPR